MNLNRWNVPSVHVCWWTAYAASLMVVAISPNSPSLPSSLSSMLLWGYVIYTSDSRREQQGCSTDCIIEDIQASRTQCFVFVRQSVAEDDSPQVITSGSGAV